MTETEGLLSTTANASSTGKVAAFHFKLAPFQCQLKRLLKLKIDRDHKNLVNTANSSMIFKLCPTVFQFNSNEILYKQEPRTAPVTTQISGVTQPASTNEKPRSLHQGYVAAFWQLDLR